MFVSFIRETNLSPIGEHAHLTLWDSIANFERVISSTSGT
jgi:hypothetical protein